MVVDVGRCEAGGWMRDLEDMGILKMSHAASEEASSVSALLWRWQR